MRFDARSQAAHRAQVVEIDGIGAADRERDSVHHQREALPDAFEVVKRLAAGNQIIFSDDLEPIDRMRLAQDGLIVGRSQAKAEAGEFHREWAGR